MNNFGEVTRPRFRPRFSLRTLFVALTIAGIALGWLAWQANIVRHREQMRAQIEAAGGAIFFDSVDWMHSPDVRELRKGDYQLQVSAIRRWLGDRRIGFIGFNRQLTEADRQAIEAFPEAQVHGVP